MPTGAHEEAIVSIANLWSEARIRDWMSKPGAAHPPSPADLPSSMPLEVQLFDDICALEAQIAKAPSSDEAAGWRTKSRELELRLMVVLEGEHRVLAAQHFAQQLVELRRSLHAEGAHDPSPSDRGPPGTAKPG